MQDSTSMSNAPLGGRITLLHNETWQLHVYYSMKIIECICESCQVSFNKPLNEYNRSIKIGRKFYCSRRCAGRAIGKTDHLDKYKGQGNISQFSRNKIDEFTGLREFIRRAKGRNKLGNLTLEMLKERWDNQKGICPYSGVKLQFPSYKQKNSSTTVASLDRIDSNLPYTENNIQFISAAMNYMKNVLSHEETMELCRTIAKFHN